MTDAIVLNTFIDVGGLRVNFSFHQQLLLTLAKLSSALKIRAILARYEGTATLKKYFSFIIIIVLYHS